MRHKNRKRRKKGTVRLRPLNAITPVRRRAGRVTLRKLERQV